MLRGTIPEGPAMADQTTSGKGPTAADFTELMLKQSQAAMEMFGAMTGAGSGNPFDPAEAAHWAGIGQRLQSMLVDFHSKHGMNAANPATFFVDPELWLSMAEVWYRQMPLADPASQSALWQGVMEAWGIGGGEAKNDRRFADRSWHDQPAFALIHQTYLNLAKQLADMADRMDGLDPVRKEQFSFVLHALVDALSPSNFAMTNPQVLERAMETRGESLVKGFGNLLRDLARGQLTHTDPEAFRLGENIAITPGKVVHETPLYQLIQYAPATEKVLATPLVIFPPWINRFYILDLNPKKSFVRWAVEQGITVFMVSWKSADPGMAQLAWDDYVAAQIDAIDTIRGRLKVPAVHTIGYCVAGTTLAATLAVLARRGEAEKVKSATFFTAQVDFEKAGELKHFVDDVLIDNIARLSPDGFLDGRYMAATFNLLRGNDLIWSYVVNNYLLGQDYPAFDLLHWNGDVTNLPVGWLQAYLKDLYRDNRLAVPDALSACDVPIDLSRIETPCYIQAGREDHIAPPESVWKFTRHLRGPYTFVLAGSGHIAGVVNPPAANKYQYWTNDAKAETLEQFAEGATEHPGSWWPHWAAWLRAQDPAETAVKGKRDPGRRGDKVIEDAPGRYVKTR
jgi:polyhydroxyalkanoate synthase subunit PhaC